MTYSRSKLREKTMVILYQIEINKNQKINYKVDDVIKNNLDIENQFVTSIVYGVIKNRQMLDTLANKYMDNWTINRIDITGASILRMALYELKFTDTPDVVIINEAVELAKKYSDESVRKMINAVLDKVIKE